MVNPFEDLAQAIIVQAVSDYRYTTNRLQAKLENGRLQNRKKEIEEFFCSSWFQMLTDLNGERLMHQLQADMQKRENKA